MKKCKKCGDVKVITEFYRKSNIDNYQSQCIECHNLYMRNHYINNRSYYLKKSKKRNEIQVALNKTFIYEIKSKPCMDCGKSYSPWVMDFDHRDPTNKLNDVATLTRYSNLLDLKKEVEKCDLVCANCHRERTHKGHVAKLNKASDYESEDV